MDSLFISDLSSLRLPQSTIYAVVFVAFLTCHATLNRLQPLDALSASISYFPEVLSHGRVTRRLKLPIKDGGCLNKVHKTAATYTRDIELPLAKLPTFEPHSKQHRRATLLTTFTCGLRPDNDEPAYAGDLAPEEWPEDRRTYLSAKVPFLDSFDEAPDLGLCTGKCPPPDRIGDTARQINPLVL